MVRTLSKKVLTRTLLDFNLTIKFYVYKLVPELGFESSLFQEVPEPVRPPDDDPQVKATQVECCQDAAPPHLDNGEVHEQAEGLLLPVQILVQLLQDRLDIQTHRLSPE